MEGIKYGRLAGWEAPAAASALPLALLPYADSTRYSGWHTSDQLRTGTDQGNPTV